MNIRIWNLDSEIHQPNALDFGRRNWRGKKVIIGCENKLAGAARPIKVGVDKKSQTLFKINQNSFVVEKKLILVTGGDTPGPVWASYEEQNSARNKLSVLLDGALTLS